MYLPPLFNIDVLVPASCRRPVSGSLSGDIGQPKHKPLEDADSREHRSNDRESELVHTHAHQGAVAADGTNVIFGSLVLSVQRPFGNDTLIDRFYSALESPRD